MLTFEYLGILRQASQATFAPYVRLFSGMVSKRFDTAIIIIIIIIIKILNAFSEKIQRR